METTPRRLRLAGEEIAQSSKPTAPVALTPTMTWNTSFVAATKSFWDPLFRFAMSLSHNEATSEDLVQVTLMKGLQSFERFVSAQFPGVLEPIEAHRAMEHPENAAHLKNWLYRILKNSFLDENVRKRRSRFEVSTDDTATLRRPKQKFKDSKKNFLAWPWMTVGN
jgi:DNA-directed RNA polymerase specialized sigma24 family protein